MQKHAKLTLVLSMLIFSTIGIARRYIRSRPRRWRWCAALIGAVFLLLSCSSDGRNFHGRRCGKPPEAALSGVLVALNWILLFEAYRFDRRDGDALLLWPRFS